MKNSNDVNLKIGIKLRGRTADGTAQPAWSRMSGEIAANVLPGPGYVGILGWMEKESEKDGITSLHACRSQAGTMAAFTWVSCWRAIFVA